MDEEGQIEIGRYIERKKIERKRDKKSVIFYFKQNIYLDISTSCLMDLAP